MKTLASIAGIVGFASSLTSSLLGTTAFILVQPRKANTGGCSATVKATTLTPLTSILAAASTAGGKNGNGDDDNKDPDDNEKDEIDLNFYRDLERAKIEKLGASIPPEQARQSALQAEQDFLSAMKEVQAEFIEAKEEMGSDGAVEMFLNRIRKEDEKRDRGRDFGLGTSSSTLSAKDEDEDEAGSILEPFQ